MDERERKIPGGSENDGKRQNESREEHSENPRHEHSSDESWSTPRWGPLLDEHDTGAKK